MLVTMSLVPFVAFLLLLLTSGVLLHRRSVGIGELKRRRDESADAVSEKYEAANEGVVHGIMDGRPLDEVFREHGKTVSSLLPGVSRDANWHNEELERFVDARLDEGVESLNRRVLLNGLVSCVVVAFVTVLTMAVLYHFHSDGSLLPEAVAHPPHVSGFDDPLGVDYLGPTSGSEAEVEVGVDQAPTDLIPGTTNTPAPGIQTQQ